MNFIEQIFEGIVERHEQRKNFVLAVLSTSTGKWGPSQLQKIFFLLDRKAGSLVNGPFFDFIPYDYGPYDAAVYRIVEGLAEEDQMIIFGGHFQAKSYQVSVSGFQRGAEVLSKMDSKASRYIRDLSEWVRSQTFSGLIASIYKAYPEMKVRAVFREHLGHG